MENYINRNITIIVTIYNIAEYLPRFFESVKNQSYKDFKLLLIDDGSTDESFKLCEDYYRYDNNTQLVKLNHVGISRARNIAMGYINTPFTAYADGDDFVEEDYLKHLVDAQIRYDADLVISRVKYLNEDLSISGSFPERGEVLINNIDFIDRLPELLDDRRLNYLYGKLYKTELLRSLRVDNDVQQGSDTMINSQYISLINNIVEIDDLDYNYIKYSSRSVTSYNGKDSYERVCRINKYLYNKMKEYNYLSKNMLYTIDKRVFLSATWCIDAVKKTTCNKKELVNSINEIVNNQLYIEVWNRNKEKLNQFNLEIINPYYVNKYVDDYYKNIRITKIKGLLRPFIPNILVEKYHEYKNR